jgi:hypothetical protein
MTGQQRPSTPARQHPGSSRSRSDPASAATQVGPAAAEPVQDRLMIGVGSYDRHPLHRRHAEIAAPSGAAS